MTAPAPCLAVCMPVYDVPEYEFWRSYRTLWVPGRVIPGGEKLAGITHFFDIHGHPIREARQLLTEHALSVPEVTHLLWLDADMVFPPTAAMRLLEHDLPVVGGLCHNRRHPFNPTLFRRHPNYTGRKSFGFLYHYPPDQLVPVDATGTGFLLVKREVFDTILERYGPVWWDVLDGERSEDLAFCTRAKALGFDVHVDTGLDIGHLGKIVVDREFAERNRRFEWEAWQEQPPPSASGCHASVVIPSYNQRPEHLDAAIFSALYQTMRTEVIVVDDGSTTPVVLPPGAEQVRLLRHETNRGIAAALNTGLRAIGTPWFAWLSSDDLFDPRKIEVQLRACQQARAVASFHAYQVITSDESLSQVAAMPPRWASLAEQMKDLTGCCCINGSTVFVHRDVFDSVGEFDESLRYGQDWDMWCRIGQEFLWHAVPEILGTRRSNTGLTSEIAGNAEQREVRDLEDLAIREKYGRWAAMGACADHGA